MTADTTPQASRDLAAQILAKKLPVLFEVPYLSRRWAEGFNEGLQAAASLVIAQQPARHAEPPPYCEDYHCAGDCGLPHNQAERLAYFTEPAPREAIELLELIDTLLASVNGAHRAKRDDWRDACREAADEALGKIRKAIVALATSPQVEPATFQTHAVKQLAPGLLEVTVTIDKPKPSQLVTLAADIDAMEKYEQSLEERRARLDNRLRQWQEAAFKARQGLKGEI